MRRALLTLFFAIISLGAWAQSTKNVLEIDPASFRPVQTDALSGVAIDKIGLDRSKRPCARIKMHVNRMTREEIDQIMVQPVGGNVMLTKKITAVEGNGLIIEMTAKEQTRFYLHHDKYGDSNEVMVDLAPNKEYYLDAQLNLLLSIAIASNVKGADIYIDNTYKGRTGENYMLTVEDITPGEHKIKVQHGAAMAEQTVNVNSGNISFRVEVNDQSSRPQYVVFNVLPKNAMVFVDNKPLTTTSNGVASIVLQNGSYSWRVIANGYHEQGGTFTVSGEKIVKDVTLSIDAAMVTISAGEGCEIWVNNELKGASPWRGQLLSGTYIFEARKAGHRTTTLSQTITSSAAEQSYTLDAPTPIKGTLNITSDPAMADVLVDGKNLGQTPLFVDVLVGKHHIKVTQLGYVTWENDVEVADGQAISLNATLEKNTKTYKVGDYYNENGKEGVVFWVDETGRNGRIVSLTESKELYVVWTLDEYEQTRIIGADAEFDGSNNMAVVKQRKDWQSKYPAFKWCADLGEGWYLPAIEELKLFTTNKAIRDAINQTLSSKGTKIGENHAYWSSTEDHDYPGALRVFGSYDGFSYKNNSLSVRAVAKFDNSSRPVSQTTTTQSTTSYTNTSSSTPGTYKVGDYYNENGKEGVVFWVDVTGRNGKIVSFAESETLVWSVDKKERKDDSIGVDDRHDGANNMAKVKQIKGWKSKYPAFKWCANLGDGWYLPSIEELKTLMLDKSVHDAVNLTLSTKGTKIPNIGTSHSYWSSTEYERYSSEFHAWDVGMLNGDIGFNNAAHGCHVRAVAAF